MEEKYLLMITPEENHNKFYHIQPIGNGQFTATYGRVGTSGTVVTYTGEDKYHALLDQKLRKGYRDKTLVRADAPASAPALSKDTEDILRILYDAAHGMVNRHIANNMEVSQSMVDAAVDYLTRLSNNMNTLTVDQFNQVLLEVFYELPRATSEVSSMLAQKQSDFASILNREYALVRSLGANVSTSASTDSQMPDTKDLTVEKCDDKVLDELKGHMDHGTASEVTAAWSIHSAKQDKHLESWMKKKKITDSKYLYHGSGTENWWSILVNGLLLNPLNVQVTGHMFGHGLYFAPKAGKSAGYTSLNGSYWRGGRSKKGYVGLYKVAYGKPVDVTQHTTACFQYPTGFPRGHYCLHAHAGVSLYNDEVVVYDEHACAIRYLIELAK